MGPTTIVYLGVARLPEPSIAAVGQLGVELAVEAASGRIVAVATNLGLPTLNGLLWEVLVGRKVGEAGGRAVLEVEVRYSSPLTAAVRAALESALRRALDEPAGGFQRPRAATNGHRSPELAAVDVAG